MNAKELICFSRYCLMFFAQIRMTGLRRDHEKVHPAMFGKHTGEEIRRGRIGTVRVFHPFRVGSLLVLSPGTLPPGYFIHPLRGWARMEKCRRIGLY
jgi:hypothetical protein